jgi:hypothetical protein
MKRTFKLSILAILSVFVISSCKNKVIKPGKYAKCVVQSWQAKLVKENGTVVYTRGATTNAKAAYSSFKMIINENNSATLTEVDNSTFSGNWELAGEKTLILKNLNPVPSKTKGSIEYTITKFTNSELYLTKATPNPKTGGSTNEYVLEKTK